jgi:hypothetical protein
MWEFTAPYIALAFGASSPSHTRYDQIIPSNQVFCIHKLPASVQIIFMIDKAARIGTIELA